MLLGSLTYDRAHWRGERKLLWVLWHGSTCARLYLALPSKGGVADFQDPHALSLPAKTTTAVQAGGDHWAGVYSRALHLHVSSSTR